MEQINLYERVSPLLPGENAFPERQVCEEIDYIRIINLTVYWDLRKLLIAIVLSYSLCMCA